MKKRTIEEYVEIIFDIQNKKKIVHTNDVASSLEVNPASVTEMFGKLTLEGYINYEKYSGVNLTDKGKKIAIKLKKKHETLRDFLVIIGVDKEIADSDACKIEHSVNPHTVDKLQKFVEFAKREDSCNRWLDHFKYFDKTGEFIFCTPSDDSNCPVHKNS
jgi:DtxR family Mn-dependent transcriptional regulator